MSAATGPRDNAPYIAVEKSGAGKPVILVHGLGGTGNVWQPQIQMLSERCTAIRLDLEGSGRSPARKTLSIASWVADIEALMASERIERATFIGHSLGTLVIQHFAAKNPQKVERIALLGVNRAPEDARRQTVRDRAAKVRKEGMLEIADGVVKAALSEHTRQHKPEVAAFVRELLMRQDPEGYARTCEAVAESVGADLSKIACPVLLISGSDDTVSTVAAAERMQAELKDAKLTVLQQCGHWLTIERPMEVIRALAQFLQA